MVLINMKFTDSEIVQNIAKWKRKLESDPGSSVH